MSSGSRPKQNHTSCILLMAIRVGQAHFFHCLPIWYWFRVCDADPYLPSYGTTNRVVRDVTLAFCYTLSRKVGVVHTGELSGAHGICNTSWCNAWVALLVKPNRTRTYEIVIAPQCPTPNLFTGNLGPFATTGIGARSYKRCGLVDQWRETETSLDLGILPSDAIKKKNSSSFTRRVLTWLVSLSG